MEMKIVGVTLVAFVSLVVLAAVLMPILDDARATEDKFTNDGYFTYNAVTDDTDDTFTWDPSDPQKLTMGDKVIDMATIITGNGNLTIIGSDNFTCRYYQNNTVAGGLQVYGVGGYKSYNPANENATVTINVTNTTMAFDGTTDKSYTMGNRGFVIDFDGDGALTLKYSDEAAYVMDDSEIYLCGTTFVTGSGTNDFVGVFGYGSIDDGVTLSSFYGNTGDNTVSFGTPTITYTEDPDHIDLYQISKVDFALTQNSATVDATYSYFVVPTEVTAERSVHFTDNMNELLGVIPVLVIVAILLGVVALVIRSKLE